jgi:signal transduction histidine kinase
MNVLLISVDQKLEQFCRKVIADCVSIDCQMRCAASFAANPEPDLTIWDYSPDMAAPPASICSDHKQTILLVGRKHIPMLGNIFPVQAASILLKPVNHAMLRVFIEHGLARHESVAGLSKELTADRLEKERDQLLQFLLKANLNLQEYDQDRTNFLARTVHDFRTPLTALQGYCGLLLEQSVGYLNADQMDLLRGMHRSAKRLSALATALLDLSAGRHLERRPDVQRIELENCIEQAMHEISPLASAKHIDIRVDLEIPPGAILFDPAQMEQVLVNLLENACKFTPKHGLVRVLGHSVAWDRSGTPKAAAAWEQSNAYRVDISDSGPGIIPEYLDEIFEEYTSYSGGRDRSGGGLGLAICRMILASHHGRIWADSKSDGATFSFVVPCSAENFSVASGQNASSLKNPKIAGR